MNKRIIITCISVFLVLASARAEVVAAFGSEGSLATKFKASGPSAESIAVEDTAESLKLRSPNFWSLIAQGEKLFIDLSSAEPADNLAIEVKGTIQDTKPFLRLLLWSPDWSRQSEYVFDLSGINPDEYTVVKASTALGSPVNPDVAKHLAKGDPIGGMQIIAKAAEGNRSWRIELKSLQVLKP